MAIKLLTVDDKILIEENISVFMKNTDHYRIRLYDYLLRILVDQYLPA